MGQPRGAEQRSGGSAKRKLEALNTAARLEDLRVPPSNRLEKLREPAMTDDEFAPVSPGEMLREEFLKEYGLSQNRLARAIGISPNRIAEIVSNRRRITADTALRLGLYFGNSPEFWLNLQTRYDLKLARRQLSPEAAERIRAHRAA